ACVDAGAETRAELSIRAARADERMALVDRAVAVVVESVAARLDALVAAGIEALPPERPTAGRGGAGAHPVRVAEARGRREPLVGRPVAVVVAPVADLGACEVARVLAAVRGLAVAVVVAGEATRERAAPARARRDAVGIRADPTAGPAVARVGRERVALVGHPVAIVVDRVATLELRARRAMAAQGPARTAHHAGRAGAGVAAARCASARVALVDVAVAVVVEAVARLGARPRSAGARQRP